MLFDKTKLIGIFGFGVTGRAVSEWCDRHNVKKIIFDDNLGGCEPFSEEKIRQCDCIVRSPSFLDNNRWVKFANFCNIRCISELDLAALFWKGKIIAVTGTDGKTTTTEFLAHALTNAGCVAVAVGNNGRSLLSYLDNSVNAPSSFAIVEVSSFQASEVSEFRPDYMIWTNFAPDHINIHGSLDNYFSSKYNLVKLCKNLDEKHILIGRSVAKYAQSGDNFGLLSEKNVYVGIEHLPEDSALNIPVQHENYALIEELWNVLDLPVKKLEESAISFKLPKHRLQKIVAIDKLDGKVEFWDDSKATNFHSFQAALRSFDQKVILIAGGRSKGENIEQYVDEILQKVKSIFLIGETGAQIYEQILVQKYDKFFEFIHYYGGERKDVKKTLSKIVNDAFYVALPGDVVLLSPGFASFDMFSSFEERGDLYTESVLKLKF